MADKGRTVGKANSITCFITKSYNMLCAKSNSQSDQDLINQLISELTNMHSVIFCAAQHAAPRLRYQPLSTGRSPIADTTGAGEAAESCGGTQKDVK